MAQQRRFLSWRMVVPSGVVGLTASVGMLASGAGVAAATSAAGRSCDHPLSTFVSAKRVKSPESRLHITRRLTGGAKLALELTNQGEGPNSITAKVTGTGWRLCGINTSEGPARIEAPVSTGKIFVFIHSYLRFPSLRIWYARRNSALDGASCANPYVIYTTDNFGEDKPRQATGDRAAGQVSVSNSTPSETGSTEVTTASWQAGDGYHVCYAVGSGATSRAWVDRRTGQSETRVLNTWRNCCPGHTFPVYYFFAAFAKD